MGYAIGNLVKAGGDDCHYQFLAIIKTLAEANGWTTLRYINTGTDRELILKGVGLSGTEEIFIGWKTYQSVGGDYYNFNAATFVGYVAGNTFETQPGGKYTGVPAHNNAIGYFMAANAQRIMFCLKVGTPVYTHCYLGKLFPYARPGEYPSPLIVAGMFDGPSATRYDNTGYYFPYGGSGYAANCRMWLRDTAGNWNNCYCYPYSNANSTSGALAGVQGTNTLVPADVYYQLEPIVLQQIDNNLTPSNVWGEIDGVTFCSGFNNGPENVVQMGGSSVINQTGLTVLQAVDAIRAAGGRAFVVCQNVRFTSWCDYITLEMS